MDQEQFKSDLLSIRKMMERSAKFISLSGLSGILAGIYALIGYGVAYAVLEQGDTLNLQYALGALALVVLLMAIGTAVLLSSNKARKLGQTLWNPASKGLLQAVCIPLAAGGVIILLFLEQERYDLLVPMALIFYGMALTVGSLFTYKDVWGLGLAQLLLGLACVAIPGYDLEFWGMGFGLLHVLYGAIMYVKYERK